MRDFNRVQSNLLFSITILFHQMLSYHVYIYIYIYIYILEVRKCAFNISINILIKFLTLRAFEIFYFAPGKPCLYYVA